MKFPTNIQIVVLNGRGVVPELRDWLASLPEHAKPWLVRDWPETPGGDNKAWWLLGHARNMIVRKFLAESDKEYLLTIDDDIVPCKKSEALLWSDAPIAGARYFARWGGHCHGTGPGIVGCSFTKYRRDVLETVGEDPFTRDTESCECICFCRRAMAKGFLPIHVGAVGHYVQCVLMPDGDTYVMKSPQRPGKT